MIQLINTDQSVIRILKTDDVLPALDAADFLSPAEREQWNGFKNASRKRMFAAVRFLARDAGIREVKYQENGKPTCDECEISVSHSGSYAVLMTSRRECGVDIEKTAIKIKKISTRFLNERELEFCDQDPALLTLCWSLKEAVFKKYGHETVFFKSHQIITGIDDEKKEATVVLTSKGEKRIERLIFKKTDDEYFLVYTT